MLTRDHAHIQVISPASRDKQELMPERISSLEANGLKVSYHKLSPDPSWPFTAGTRQDRLHQLDRAIRNPDSKFILSARGGYGVSDLLDSIPWSSYQHLPSKKIVGFSDISALHSAFYTKLGWEGIHGPMPATEYWEQNGSDDVAKLIELLRGVHSPIELPVLYEGKGIGPYLYAPAFGGCLSVLTNLIGTEYFPKSLAGHIVYWEDIGEHPARILRFVNQWQQSGALRGVLGIILGRFVACDLEELCSETQLRETLARRLSLPVWFCPKFGHCSPNWPLPFGRSIELDENTLRWQLDKASPG